jgi:CBS domain-containing protein
MKVRDFCSKKVITVEPQASLREAAGLMRHNHVGALVVVEGEGDEARPKGILTDRDMIVSVIAVPGARPEGIRVCDAMSTHLAVAHEDDGVFEAAQTMAERGVRRLPVISREGNLRGLVSCDDIQQLVASEMSNLASALRKAAEREVIERRVLDGLAGRG